jgi:hypothetical protein
MKTVRNIIRISYLLMLIDIAVDVLNDNFDLCDWHNKVLLILIFISNFTGVLMDALEDLFKKHCKIDNLND